MGFGRLQGLGVEGAWDAYGLCRGLSEGDQEDPCLKPLGGPEEAEQAALSFE